MNLSKAKEGGNSIGVEERCPAFRLGGGERWQFAVEVERPQTGGTLPTGACCFCTPTICLIDGPRNFPHSASSSRRHPFLKLESEQARQGWRLVSQVLRQALPPKDIPPRILFG